MEDNNFLSVSLAFHKTRIFAQFVFVPEVILVTNFASVQVLLAFVEYFPF